MTQTVRPAFRDRQLPRLSYGIPFHAAAARHIEEISPASRVYIICSRSLAQNTNALQQLQTALGARVVGERIGMKSHTPVALANNVVTTTDLSTLSEGHNKRSDIKPPTIPIISIPTSLSAGEYSNFAGGTDDTTHQKHSFQYPIRGPQLVILDPQLTTTTPDSIWLSTGIRAVDHCVETLCSTKGTIATDYLAEKALRQLVPGLLRCRKSKLDLEARLDCQLGSVDAMAATTSGLVDMGASHGIGHQLGPLGVGHGETSCILLPAVCKYNASKNANNDSQQRVLGFLTSDPIVSEVLHRRQVDVENADLGDVLDAIIRELGLPRSLADVGVGRDKLDQLAVNSLKDRCCVTNPVPLKEKGQVLEILEMVVGA
ncbi:hypothetical protein DTO271G3_3702 [Paecilomyces variotii]|nr:hypothetical protein DTO271G3_3702 [Paecilomyces variotii]